MNSAELYRILLDDVDRREQVITEVVKIHEDEKKAALEARDDDAEARARRMLKIREGQLEVIRAIRQRALEARDVRGEPFAQTVAALENSYLTLESRHSEQDNRQQTAFRVALAGGSRAVYERETDELNLAVGRFTEIGDRLRASRRYSLD